MQKIDLIRENDELREIITLIKKGSVNTNIFVQNEQLKMVLRNIMVLIEVELEDEDLGVSRNDINEIEPQVVKKEVKKIINKIEKETEDAKPRSQH